MLRRTVAIAAIASATVAAPAIAGIAASGGSSVAQSVKLPGTLLPQAAHARDLGPLTSRDPLLVAVTMKQNLSKLYAAEKAMYTPGSSSYHHFLTPAQWKARYGVSPARLGAVRAFLTRGGLHVVNPSVLGSYVEAVGSVAQVERTFGVRIDRFATAGQTFFANTSAARVPAGVGISGVLGLESFDKYHTAGRMDPHAGQTPPAQAGCVSTVVCTGLMGPQDLWKAYGMPADDTGQGQTIGIIGEGQSSDVIQALREFEKTRSLPKVPVQVVETDPAMAGKKESQLDDAGRIEWEMDTQASTGMAPGISQLRMYMGSSLQLTQLTGALAYWVNDPQGPLQVSASLGICENNPALNPLLGTAQSAESALLAQAAMEGRTLFASTGDTGAGCSLVVSENGLQYGPIPTAEFPAIDPNTVAVGGTTLNLDPSGNVVNERAWDHTGGGPSKWVAQPGYQAGASPQLAANACSTDARGDLYGPGSLCRGDADVSALSGDGTIVVNHRFGDTVVPSGSGDPQTVPSNGFDMVDTCPSTDSNDVSEQGHTVSGSGGLPVALLPACAYGAAPGTTTDHFSEGGTSLSSPLWAGIWARVQAHHDAVNPTTLAPDPKQSLGFANEVIYKLAQTAGKSDFNDIVAGANPLPAGPGWDYPTGWGSPNTTHLVADATGDGKTAAVGQPITFTGDPARIVTATDPTQVNPPACGPEFYDPTRDAPDNATLGLNNDDQLDYTQGNLGLKPDAGDPSGYDLRVVLNVANLTKAIPPGSLVNDYEAYWTLNGQSYGVQVWVDPTGTVTYTDGSEKVSTNAAGQTTYTYTPNSAGSPTGVFTEGPNGTIEVDVPLGDVGSPAIGDKLTGFGGFTAEKYAVPGTFTGPGFITDQDGPGADYTLGQKTCVDAGGEH